MSSSIKIYRFKKIVNRYVIECKEPKTKMAKEFLGCDIIYYKEYIESLFLDLCVSSILACNEETDIHAVTEYAVDLIIKYFTIYNPNINKSMLGHNILLYIDVLRNNIESILDNHGFDEMFRLSQFEFNEINDLDKFYIVTDFTSDVNSNEIRSNCLYIKIYERL